MDIYVTDTLRVLKYVKSIMPMKATEDMKALGLERDGELVAGVLYENFNGNSIWMHVATDGRSRWATRSFLRECFQYPFIQLKANIALAWVEAGNKRSSRFVEHLGFSRKAVLTGITHDAGDAIVYELKREGCRYVDPQ